MSESGNSEDDPEEIHKKRKMLSLRDNTQAWYETIGMNFLLTALYAIGGLWLWNIGVPFEMIVILLLATIAADTGSLWRTYVR